MLTFFLVGDTRSFKGVGPPGRVIIMWWCRETLLKVKSKVPPNYYDDALRIPIYKCYHINRFKVVCKFIGNANGLLLDVGCDGGTFTEYLCKCCNPSFTIGLDIDKRAVRYAQKMRSQIAFVVAHGYFLPFRNSVFRVVTLLEVLEHVDKPELMLNEARRVLVRGGIVVCLVPNENSLLFKVLWFLWTRIRGGVWKDKHITKFDKEILAEKLKKAGFSIVNSVYINLKMLILVLATVL
jgi:ubiquinone/menaquinone biosynthesis C-methylase UbiE